MRFARVSAAPLYSRTANASSSVSAAPHLNPGPSFAFAVTVTVVSSIPRGASVVMRPVYLPAGRLFGGLRQTPNVRRLRLPYTWIGVNFGSGNVTVSAVAVPVRVITSATRDTRFSAPAGGPGPAPRV